MLIFSNPNPIEVNEGDGQVVIEIDPIASGITEPTEVEISTVNGSAISTPLIENVEGVDFGSIQNLTTIIDPNNADTLTFSIDIIDDAIAESDESFQLQITSLEDEDLNGITSIVITDNEAEIESELVVEGLLPEISIDNEALDEENPDETFFVNLSNANNGDIEQIVGLGIILDDDLETGIEDIFTLGMPQKETLFQTI